MTFPLTLADSTKTSQDIVVYKLQTQNSTWRPYFR